MPHHRPTLCDLIPAKYWFGGLLFIEFVFACLAVSAFFFDPGSNSVGTWVLILSPAWLPCTFFVIYRRCTRRRRRYDSNRQERYRGVIKRLEVRLSPGSTPQSRETIWPSMCTELHSLQARVDRMLADVARQLTEGKFLALNPPRPERSRQQAATQGFGYYMRWALGY